MCGDQPAVDAPVPHFSKLFTPNYIFIYVDNAVLFALLYAFSSVIGWLKDWRGTQKFRARNHISIAISMHDSYVNSLDSMVLARNLHPNEPQEAWIWKGNENLMMFKEITN